MSRTNLLLRENSITLEIREAVPRPQSFDATARTVEAIIASSTPVQRQDQRGAFMEILDPAGLDLAGSRGATVLDSHRQGGLDAVLGVLDAVRVEGGQVIGTIRFGARADGTFLDDVRSGVISQLSVGYQVSEWRDGTDGAGNRTRTAVKWTIREASFVSVGADHTTRTRGLNNSGGRATINRSIRELCHRSGVDQLIVDDLIDRGASIEDARGIVLEQLVTRGRTPIMPHNMQTLDNPEVHNRAMAEALYVRINPSFAPSGAAQQYVGLTIPEMARACLSRAGIPAHGVSSVSLIERALHTTSDFALILGDVVNRTLRASYTAAPSAIKRLARETTANDFRTKHSLLLDSSGFKLEKVNEAGEFKSGSMVEGKETYKLDTFGRIFGITRQALINDDLGAFSTIAARLGQAASAFEAQFLINLLVSQSGTGPDMSDGQPLFDTTHGNISATGAAPDETTLGAARLAMRRQTGPGGGLIVIEPKYLLAPPEMETAILKLLATIQPVEVTNVNVFSNLTPLIDPRLTNSKRWYLVADPATIDGLEYAYLSGAPGVQTESRAGFEVDGVEIKARLDFGGGFVDHRGWYTNAGQ